MEPPRTFDMNDDRQALVLVVDDNPQNLQILGSILKKSGYRTALAKDGPQALSFALKKPPDIILLDVMMPGMDGFEVCRRLKARQETAAIPVVFITAMTETESKLQGFKAGGTDYIAKPFAHQEVLARVDNIVQRVRFEAELKASKEALEEANENLERKVEERTRELRRMQSQLVLQEKMASIGQLAAGIAHELNNPVNFVYTNFHTLRENVSDFAEILKAYRDLAKKLEASGKFEDETVALKEKEEAAHLDFVLEDMDDLFEETLQGFERISWIVQSMLDFSRADPSGGVSSFDLNKAVADTLVIARNEYKYHARVKQEPGELPGITCVPQQIHMVLLNLLVNASQALKARKSDEEGLIVVKTWHEGTDVYCEISDNGPGIPEALQNRIFEPFFTTKDVGEGTGLGLSISYDIVVHKHGGSLTVASSPGEGTTFVVRLPVEPPGKPKSEG